MTSKSLVRVRKRGLALLIILVLMLSMSPAFTSLSPALRVSTDKSTYQRGETVTIYVSGVPPNTDVAIEVKSPLGTPVFVDQVTTGSDGTASTRVTIRSDWPLGRYTVSANAPDVGESATTTFYVKQPSTITITLGKTSLTFGESLRINGDISPEPGTSVTVIIRISGPVTVDLTVEATPTGEFSILYTPPKGGTYEVYAEWTGTEVISGSRSDTLTFTVRKLLVNITVSVTPVNITYGESVFISGRIEPAEVGANQEVFLTYEVDGVTGFIASVITNAEGKFNYTWTPPYGGSYRIVAFWPGTDVYARVSAETSLFVRKLPSEITVAVSPSRITFTESVTISGRLTPPLEGVTVTIECKREGEEWREIAKVITEADGSFSYRWTPERGGTYLIRASWEGTMSYKGAVSAEVTLIVARAATSITISVDRTRVLLGESIVVSGLLKCEFTGRVMAGYKIIVQMITPEGKVFNYTAITDDEGRYRITIMLDVVGNWIIRAIWPGDTDYESSMSTDVVVGVEGTSLEAVVSVSTTEIIGKKVEVKKVKEIKVRINVYTNSTVRAVRIMRNRIEAVVEGPKGTKGYLIMAVPKELLAAFGLTINDITVLINGVPRPFTYTETPRSYMLRVEYSHSVVRITIKLGFELALKVVDQEKAPVKGAVVELYKNGVLVNATVTDERGVANFTAVPRGTYALRVMWGGVEVLRLTVEVKDDTYVSEVAKVYSLKVVVRGLFGMPAGGITVKTALPDGTVIVATTGADGVAVLKQLPIASYRVEASSLTTDTKITVVDRPGLEVYLKVMTPTDAAIIVVAAILAILAIIAVLIKKGKIRLELRKRK